MLRHGRRERHRSAGRAASSSSSSCNPTPPRSRSTPCGRDLEEQPRGRERHVRRPGRSPTRSSSGSSPTRPRWSTASARGSCRRRSGSSRSNKDADVVEALGEHFREQARRAARSSSPRGRPARSRDLSSALTVGIARRRPSCCSCAALLLILNTIRMAMFARRREIEVMKLVGATNWFIRVPFMLEGLVQGVLGAVVAIVGLVIFKPFFESWLPKPDEIPLVSGFTVSDGEPDRHLRPARRGRRAGGHHRRRRGRHPLPRRLGRGAPAALSRRRRRASAAATPGGDVVEQAHDLDAGGQVGAVLHGLDVGPQGGVLVADEVEVDVGGVVAGGLGDLRPQIGQRGSWRRRSRCGASRRCG